MDKFVRHAPCTGPFCRTLSYSVSLCRSLPSYGFQSAMKRLVSFGLSLCRFEAKISFLPSGENIGKAVERRAEGHLLELVGGGHRGAGIHEVELELPERGATKFDAKMIFLPSGVHEGPNWRHRPR